MQGSLNGAGPPTVERITPAMARRLLAANRHNRNLRPARVSQFAGAIARGEWELNGETIKIAEDGTLLDGQHRLQAVVEAKRSIQSVVVRGLSRDAQDTVDTGRRRRLADVLAIEHYKDPHALAAALNVLHRYRSKFHIDYSHGNAPSVQQALMLLQEQQDLEYSVRVARRVTHEIGGPIGVFAALHNVFFHADLEPAEEFYARLEDGVELSRGDPVLHLRRQILRPRSDRSYAQSPGNIAAITIKAFNLRRVGRDVELLSYKKSEPFPRVEERKRGGKAKRGGRAQRG